MPEHTPISDAELHLLGRRMTRRYLPATETERRLGTDLREARRLLRTLSNEAHGVVSLGREGLRQVVGNTNVRVLEDKIASARRYLAACEGKEQP